MVESRKKSLQVRITKLKADKIRNITLNVLVTFVFQIMVVSLAFWNLVIDPQFFCIVISNQSMPVLFTRFVCASIMHLAIVDEVMRGF